MKHLSKLVIIKVVFILISAFSLSVQASASSGAGNPFDADMIKEWNEGFFNRRGKTLSLTTMPEKSLRDAVAGFNKHRLQSTYPKLYEAITKELNRRTPRASTPAKKVPSSPSSTRVPAASPVRELSFTPADAEKAYIEYLAQQFLKIVDTDQFLIGQYDFNNYSNTILNSLQQYLGERIYNQSVSVLQKNSMRLLINIIGQVLDARRQGQKIQSGPIIRMPATAYQQSSTTPQESNTNKKPLPTPPPVKKAPIISSRPTRAVTPIAARTPQSVPLKDPHNITPPQKPVPATPQRSSRTSAVTQQPCAKQILPALASKVVAPAPVSPKTVITPAMLQTWEDARSNAWIGLSFADDSTEKLEAARTFIEKNEQLRKQYGSLYGAIEQELRIRKGVKELAVRRSNIPSVAQNKPTSTPAVQVPAGAKVFPIDLGWVKSNNLCRSVCMVPYEKSQIIQLDAINQFTLEGVGYATCPVQSLRSCTLLLQYAQTGNKQFIQKLTDKNDATQFVKTIIDQGFQTEWLTRDFLENVKNRAKIPGLNDTSLISIVDNVFELDPRGAGIFVVENELTRIEGIKNKIKEGLKRKEFVHAFVMGTSDETELTGVEARIHFFTVVLIKQGTTVQYIVVDTAGGADHLQGYALDRLKYFIDMLQKGTTTSRFAARVGF